MEEEKRMKGQREKGQKVEGDANEAALRYLAPRERTAAEVLDHLLSKGFDRAAADAAVGGLAAAGYINDEDLCRRWIRRAADKGRGRRRIARELTEKGLSSDLVLQLLADEYGREEELAAAREQAAGIWAAEAGRAQSDKGAEAFDAGAAQSDWRRRQEGRQAADALRGKIARRLAAQGFASDLIYKVLGELQND